MSNDSSKCRALNDYSLTIEGYTISFDKDCIYDFVKRVTNDFVILDNNRFGVVLSSEEFSKNFKIIFKT